MVLTHERLKYMSLKHTWNLQLTQSGFHVRVRLLEHLTILFKYIVEFQKV